MSDPRGEENELEAERKERAERASREPEHTGPHEDKQTGGDLDAPQGTVIGGTSGAPPSVTKGERAAGGTAGIGPEDTARPEDSPEESSDESPRSPASAWRAV